MKGPNVAMFQELGELTGLGKIGAMGGTYLLHWKRGLGGKEEIFFLPK